MPLNNPSPQFGLLTAYDLRDYSGLEIFSRSGGSAVSMPTFTAGQGVYEDALFFLNGRMIADDLSNAFFKAKSFGSSWVVSIDEFDKIKITSDVDFEITNIGSNDALGIGTSTINATQSGSDYHVFAPNDWTRGSINLESVNYRIDEVGGGAATFNAPSVNIHIQDLSCSVRDRASTSDADVFGVDSLEKLDQVEQGNETINWFINDQGYVACAYLTSLGHISWTNTTVRDLLGFTGNESPATYATSYSLITATHKASGVLIPSRPYQNHHLRVQNLSQSRRKISGGYVSNYIGTYVTSALSFDLDALLDAVDDYQHFVHRWLPYCSAGERINFYQDWGDSRRALRTAQTNNVQTSYDSLYTSEDNGERGRIRGSLVTSDFNLAYPSRLKRRVPVSLEIEHL
tara:strand:+ start:192 stop:1397 length:1206 start_codon:yes stop_codon:yes gene_type:complete